MNMETTQNKIEGQSYEEYAKLGGILNEEDYKSAFSRAKDINLTTFNSPHVDQAKGMGKDIGMDHEVNDPRIRLYTILRDDNKPDNKDPNRYTQKFDRRLFAEALLMLGKTEELRKFKEKNPLIFSRGK